MIPAQNFKLALPSVAGQVTRLRLIEALRLRMRDTPLVWMVGLPGAGKTSLAAQTLHHAKAEGEQPVWYRLDEDDAAGVFDALRRSAEPKLRARLPAWSPDHQPELRSFTRRFFGTLAGTGIVNIVFDDCHRIGESGAFFEMLDAAREVLGTGLHLLLISRRPPPPQLARGQVAGWLSVFDDLKLSLPEATEIAQKVAGHSLSPAQTERLMQAQGWMAHVMALAQSSELDDVPPPPPGAAALVGDYLANELLMMMPPARRAAFRQLAELPEIPRRLLVTGRIAPETGRRLEDLGRRRYFVEYSASEAWRMHDLLRDGLRGINSATDTAAELAAARRELAQWIAADAPETAMNLMVAANDIDEAAALLSCHGQGWLERGRHRQILGWIAVLMPNETEGGSARAGLLLWQAEALLPLEPERARPLFAECRQLFAALREKRVPPPGRAVAGWPMPVQIAALNGLSVQLFDDKPAERTPEQAKPPMKLRELLAILVAERDGASQGDLGEWLWPEADGDRAAAALKTAIHRLRLWLGADAVTVRDRNVSLNPLHVGCDLWCWLDRPQLDDAQRVLSGFESPPVLALRRRLRQTRGS